MAEFLGNSFLFYDYGIRERHLQIHIQTRGKEHFP